MTNYELLIKKTKTGFNAIVFEIFEDQKAVVDILQNSMPWYFTHKNGFVTNEGTLEVTISNEHANVDFGRAKTLAAKIKKICESL